MMTDGGSDFVIIIWEPPSGDRRFPRLPLLILVGVKGPYSSGALVSPGPTLLSTPRGVLARGPFDGGRGGRERFNAGGGCCFFFLLFFSVFLGTVFWRPFVMPVWPEMLSGRALLLPFAMTNPVVFELGAVPCVFTFGGAPAAATDCCRALTASVGTRACCGCGCLTGSG